MTDKLSTWDEVRRLAEELEVQIHLAGMEARGRWHELEPRLEKLEKQLAERAEDAVVHELHEVRDALRTLRDDVYARARGNFTQGW